MSEIEKLYENAGIKKEVIPCPAKYYGYDCTRNNWDDEDCSCDIEGYPSFTAEKQIELICFLLNADIKIDICKEPNMKMEICDIAEALAEVTNTIWQDLTPEEKQQVKGILE